jgi:hypothetical protein
MTKGAVGIGGPWRPKGGPGKEKESPPVPDVKSAGEKDYDLPLFLGQKRIRIFPVISGI